jgi:hypothetical protein
LKGKCLECKSFQGSGCGKKCHMLISHNILKTLPIATLSSDLLNKTG